MSEAPGVFAVTATKRRRYLWCAWWTGEPTREPFRKPDAWAGGARSADDAKAAAELAAGRPLREVDGRWAGAWARVQRGLPPWSAPRAPKPAAPRPANDPYAILGVPSAATLAEVKRAFRRLALLHHPDKGGTPEAFVRVKRAYDAIVAKREKKKPPRR